MEQTYVLALGKESTMRIINTGMRATLEQRLEYLAQIEIFQGIDIHVLLPIANNLEVKRYKYGEFILREGQAPKGLFMITKGQCRVGSEQISMRSKDIYPEGGHHKEKHNSFKIKGNFHDMENKINIFDKGNHLASGRADDSKEPKDLSVALEVLRLQNDDRVFQNDRIYYDEKGHKINDHIVYKDFVRNP